MSAPLTRALLLATCPRLAALRDEYARKEKALELEFGSLRRTPERARKRALNEFDRALDEAIELLKERERQ